MTAYPLSKLPWKSKGVHPSIALDEKLLRSAQRHKIRYLPPFVLYILFLFLCMGILFAAVSLREASPVVRETFFLIAIAMMTIVQHWFFHTILSENTCDIILTNKRMIFVTHHLWFNDSLHDISLGQIKAVEAHTHGILRHILNYGNLWFDTGGSAAEESNQTITFVPKPQAWADEIARAMKAA